jgi:bile acid:Na+ symporter, BASS family
MGLAAVIALALKVSIALNVLAVGLAARPADVVSVLRSPGRLLRSLVAMDVVMPLFAAGLAAIFPLHPAVKVALVALAVSPVPPLLPRKQLKGGGDAGYTIGLLVAAALVATVLLPVAVPLLGRVFGRAAHVPFTTVISIVATTVLAPLAVGIATRHFARGLADRLVRPMAVAALVLLAATALPILVGAWPAIVALIGNGTLAALAAFALVGLVVGHWLGGPDPNDRMVLALATASRHPGVAVAIATANVSEPRPIIAAVLLYLIVGAVVSVPYMRWRRTRGRLQRTVSSIPASTP